MTLGRVARVVSGILAVGLAAAAMAVGGEVPAAAQHQGSDTTPPQLVVPPTPSFVVGSQIIRGFQFDDESAWNGLGEMTENIRFRIRWRGYDAGSGICGYDVWANDQHLYPDDYGPLVQGTLSTEYREDDTDYDDQFGGGQNKTYMWTIIARDCAGNTTAAQVRGRPAVVQEDGWSFGYFWPAPVYSGAWARSYCDCWSMGAVMRTTQRGASATITNQGQARAFALVVEKAPNRGQFEVQVNGVRRAVVDTGTAAGPVHRVVAWQGTLAANDVLKVVNLATSGRPRIDLDAYLVQGN